MFVIITKTQLKDARLHREEYRAVFKAYRQGRTHFYHSIYLLT